MIPASQSHSASPPQLLSLLGPRSVLVVCSWVLSNLKLRNCWAFFVVVEIVLLKTVGSPTSKENRKADLCFSWLFEAFTTDHPSDNSCALCNYNTVVY